MTRSTIVVRAAIGCAAAVAIYVLLFWRPTYYVRDHFTSRDPSALKIVFIGNSLTFYNDLAAQVGLLLRAKDPARALAITDVVSSGVSLANHLKDGSAARTISRGPWDFVVLQELSARPLDEPAAFEASVRTFDALARRAGAKTLLYELWPRASQDARRLHESYMRVADAVHVTLVPVGPAWERARLEDPKLTLYQPDGYHPMPTGTYLAACVFYATLSGEKPEHLPPLHTPPDIAVELQRLAAP